jgi:hypothetical protein
VHVSSHLVAPGVSLGKPKKPLNRLRDSMRTTRSPLLEIATLLACLDHLRSLRQAESFSAQLA